MNKNIESNNNNKKLTNMEREISLGESLENEFPHYLNLIELTRGQIQLTNYDKILILRDFCITNGCVSEETDVVDFGFRMLTLIHENKYLSTKKITQKLRKIISKRYIIDNVGTLKIVLKQILDRRFECPLNYLRMSSESLEKNIGLFGLDEICKNKI